MRSCSRDQAGYKACVEAFGPAILDDQGRIDRAALGAIVFQDAARRRQLEAITHPLIQAELNRQAKASSSPLWFAEVPLLFEAGMEKQFDEIITVTAPLETILQRLQQGRGLSPQQARARMAAQMSQEEKKPPFDADDRQRRGYSRNARSDSTMDQGETRWN